MQKMNTLVANLRNIPQFSPQSFLFHSPPFSKKTRHHSHPFPRKFRTLTFCTFTASGSLSCGGWDDPRFIGDPSQTGESNQLQNFLNSLGINDRKYVFVYLLGFVCALALSRVKVSSIIAIPGCVIVFALGFSMGFVNKRSPLGGFVEKLNNLVDCLNGFDLETGNLKKSVRKGIENNQITVDDLQNFEKILESMNFSSLNARKVVQGCIESMSVEGGIEMEKNTSQKSSKKKKEPGKYGFDFSRMASGLFQTKSGSKSSKTRDAGENEFPGVKMSSSKEGNILTSATIKGHSNSLSGKNLDNINGTSRHSFDDDATRSDEASETFPKGTKNVASDENANFSEMDCNTVKSIFNREEYSYRTSRVQFMRNQGASRKKSHPSEYESWASDDGLGDSVDFNVNLGRTKTEASYFREQKVDNLEEISGRFGGKENGDENYRHFVSEEMRNHEKEPFMASGESDFDLQFNKYLSEANFLVKEAKDSLMRQGSDSQAEDAFYKSAILLSKAIDIRPMSLLAVGQLGNTYFLHGEVKLRISRDLRALLTDTVPEIREGLDDTVPRKDKMVSYLVNVCEECEELLVKAGRQYKLALSIDGNDVKALYNWGLALSLRAQLIADIGPGAARDADKVFLAAIDKFDAMMSRGNMYAPDALFRWATALQHRSRLRPRSSREKVKLLQQAQRLYEDALHMDSHNLQVQDALSSCVSELKYWYR